MRGYFIKYTFIFLTGLLFFNCSTENTEEKEFYQVINVVFKNLAYEPPAPPPPSYKKSNHPDSIYQNYIIDSNQVIALKKNMKSNIIDKYNYKRMINWNLDEIIFSNVDSLNIHKIKHSSQDSITYFKEELLEPDMSDYIKFDKLISFSQVLFNTEYNEAFIIGNVSTSGLAGSSNLFFLKKINGIWQIVESFVLEIS